MTEVAIKKHAVLSPSGAHRWSRCPGSVVLEEGQPDDVSSYAKWGTAAHELASIMLEPFSGKTMNVVLIEKITVLNAEGYLGRVFTVEGEEFEVDGDMATCVNDYIQAALGYIEVGDILLVEQELPLEHITGEKGATGTGDIVVIKPRHEALVVIDLKTGRGVQVFAEGNEQCAMYADGAREEYELVYGPFRQYINVIAQPRLEHIDEETLTAAELADRIEHLAFAARDVESAKAGFAVTGRVQFLDEPADDNVITAALVPGEKQCRFCKAKAICPALAGEVRGALRKTAPADRDDFPDLSLPKQAAAAADPTTIAAIGTVDLGEAMRAAELVELWIGAVRAEVDRRLLNGQEVDGFYLGEGKRGARTWKDAEAAEARLKQARVKVDDMYAKTLISPTKAEELKKAGTIPTKVWADLAPLIGQSDPKPKVCRVGVDKNAPWKRAASAEDFPDLDEDVAEVDPFS